MSQQDLGMDGVSKSEASRVPKKWRLPSAGHSRWRAVRIELEITCSNFCFFLGLIRIASGYLQHFRESKSFVKLFQMGNLRLNKCFGDLSAADVATARSAVAHTVLRSFRKSRSAAIQSRIHNCIFNLGMSQSSSAQKSEALTTVVAMYV
jgi:hypothetical protein